MENFLALFLFGALYWEQSHVIFLGGGVMNRDVEQQVWQRVLGQSEPPRGNLRPVELETMEAAAVYRKLAGQFSGRGREQLRHLHDMQMEILACLRGIGRLSGSGGRKTAQIAVPEELAAKALERRYHCARRAVTEYTARTVDGDFGIVFQHLADLSREECVLLARLLGEQAQNISRS